MKAFNSLSRQEFERLQREYIKQAMETAQRATPEPATEQISVPTHNITEINIGSVVTGDINRTEAEISAGDVSRQETTVGDVEIPIETGDINRTEAEINAGDVSRQETTVGDVEIPIETGDINRTEAEINAGDVSRKETTVGDVEIPIETGNISPADKAEDNPAEDISALSQDVTDKPIFETIVMDSADSGKEKLKQLFGEQSPPDFSGFIARHNDNVDGKNG